MYIGILYNCITLFSLRDNILHWNTQIESVVYYSIAVLQYNIVLVLWEVLVYYSITM